MLQHNNNNKNDSNNGKISFLYYLCVCVGGCVFFTCIVVKYEYMVAVFLSELKLCVWLKMCVLNTFHATFLDVKNERERKKNT